MKGSSWQLKLNEHTPSTTARITISPYVWALLGGASAGLLALALTRVSGQWLVLAIMIVAASVLAIARQQLRRVLLAVLVFAVPLHLNVTWLYRYHQGGAAAFMLNAADIALLALLFLWLVDMARSRRRPINFFPRVTVPALAYIGVGLASAAVSSDKILVAFQLSELLKGLVLYLCLANTIRDDADWHWLLFGLMASIAFESSLGIYQAVAGKPVGLTLVGEGDFAFRGQLGGRLAIRPAGTFWYANQLALFLGMTLPVVAALMLVRSERLAWRVAAVLTVLLGLLAVVFTLSRSTWLGLVVSATILMIYGLRSRGLLPRQVLAGVAAALALSLLLNLTTGGNIVQRFTESDGGSALSRVPMAQGALRIIADHPLLGSGLNNYEMTIRQYDITGQYTLAGRLPIVHNLFLLIAAETGVLGLLAVLWLLLALARTGLSFVRGREASFRTWLAVGIMAGGLHVVNHNSLHVGIAGDTQLALMVWVLIGGLVAVANSPQPASLQKTAAGHLASKPHLPSLAE